MDAPATLNRLMARVSNRRRRLELANYLSDKLHEEIPALLAQDANGELVAWARVIEATDPGQLTDDERTLAAWIMQHVEGDGRGRKETHPESLDRVVGPGAPGDDPGRISGRVYIPDGRSD
jgi:hypothetical protein